MKFQRVTILLLALFTPLLLMGLTGRALQATPAPPSKLSSSLQTALQNSPQTAQPILIYLANQPHFQADQLPADRLTRRTQMVNHLQTLAEQSQAGVRQQLEQWQLTARPLWIVNALATTATPEQIALLAQRPDIGRVELDSQLEPFEPLTPTLHSEQAQILGGTTISSWGIPATNAPQVWHGLGVTGQNVTVAIVDSGVDWLHPDLTANYRGRLPGNIIQHAGNWYQAAVPTITTPVDWVGHGTHVAGTAVGQNGLGMAPGAKWIAVAINNQQGFIFTSYVLAAFQWLLAPNNQPALAPDLFNGSWGASGASTEFYEPLQILQTAGIMPIFAAGNRGPFPLTINTPAAFTNTLAVGALDMFNQVAWFSSRGPSEITNQTKPTLVAPGTAIVSTYPNNGYAIASGTSMATPHTTGAVALLLSANPNLTPAEITAILTSTARPLGENWPPTTAGWGALDVYAAVAPQTPAGVLAGTITGAGQPLANQPFTVTTASGQQLPFTTNPSGDFALHLRPGNYTLTAASFGYTPYNSPVLQLSLNQTINHPINLTQLPGGVVQGFIRANGQPITATVTILNTPLQQETTAAGFYSFTLPAGTYTLQVNQAGYQLLRTSFTLTANQTLWRDVQVAERPAVLLVHSDQWAYRPDLTTTYEESLINLGYGYDKYNLFNPYDLTSLTDIITSYHTVIWATPDYSPGYILAGTVISNYLGSGGNLLVSGQNVAEFDENPWRPTYPWWYNLLRGEFMGNTAVTQTIYGSPDSFLAGMAFTLNTPGSAGNQTNPDSSQKRATYALTTPILQGTQTDHALALANGQCRPYRIVYFGFGLEGVNGSTRQQLLQKSFDYFQSPRIGQGLRWLEEDVSDFAVPGDTYTYTLDLQNLSETITDTLQVTVQNSLWPTQISTSTLVLGPCDNAPTVLTVTVPAGWPRDTNHTLTVQLQSTSFPNQTDQLLIQHKTPGRFLLVDDHRWYDRTAQFSQALTELGVPHDIWTTHGNEIERGSPPLNLLQMYEATIWYTAYDWFEPINLSERRNLETYLANGGRLLLTSQDFLYYNHRSKLAQTYFGVFNYQESVTPTVAYAGQLPYTPAALAQAPLTYPPYQNNSDGLLPDQNTPLLWHDRGVAVVGHEGVNEAGELWQTVLWALPLEVLPPAQHPAALGLGLGWLSDLNHSTFAVSERTAGVTDPRWYTLTIANHSAGLTNTIQATITLPAGLTPNLSSLPNGVTYQTDPHLLLWQGVLQPGQTYLISYQATPQAGLPAGTRLETQATLTTNRHPWPVVRTAVTWLPAPDLTTSSLELVSNGPQPLTNTLTYTLQLLNSGLTPMENGVVTLTIPYFMTPITPTLWASAGVVSYTDHVLYWHGRLEVTEAVTISLVLTETETLASRWAVAIAAVDDGVTDPILIPSQIWLTPHRRFLPFVAR